MNSLLLQRIPERLKKRMQGKSCFNFKTEPDPETLTDLENL